MEVRAAGLESAIAQVLRALAETQLMGAARAGKAAGPAGSVGLEWIDSVEISPEALRASVAAASVPGTQKVDVPPARERTEAPPVQLARMGVLVAEAPQARTASGESPPPPAAPPAEQAVPCGHAPVPVWPHVHPPAREVTRCATPAGGVTAAFRRFGNELGRPSLTNKFRAFWRRAPLLVTLVAWLTLGVVCGLAFRLSQPSSPDAWPARFGFGVWAVGFLVQVALGFYARVRRRSP